MRITGQTPSIPMQTEQPSTELSKEPTAPTINYPSDEAQNGQEVHSRRKRDLFFNPFRRRPPSPPTRGSSVGGSPPRLNPPPASPAPPTGSVGNAFRSILPKITGQPVANVIPSQSHAAPKTLAEVTQNLIVADRLHKAGVFSTSPQLGTVARDAFVNAGINGFVSAPLSIATYAGSAWTGEAIKGQYTSQTPILPPVHQPAPSIQGATYAGNVSTQNANVDTRLALAELRIEVVANNIMAIREGTDAKALKLVERDSQSPGERLAALEALYDVAENQLKMIGEENDMILRPYKGASGATAGTDGSRLDSLDKRFEAVNKFIGKLIVLKATDLPAEPMADTPTV